MKFSIKQLRSIINEAIYESEDEDVYDRIKLSMVPCSIEQYRDVYLKLKDKLRPLETRTDCGNGPDDPDRNIYTLWGLIDGQHYVPIISSRDRGGEMIYKVNQDFV